MDMSFPPLLLCMSYVRMIHRMNNEFVAYGLTPYPRRGFRSEPSMAVGVRRRTPWVPGSALHGSPDSSETEWEEAPVLSVNHDFYVNLTTFALPTGKRPRRETTQALHKRMTWVSVCPLPVPFKEWSLVSLGIV